MKILLVYITLLLLSVSFAAAIETYTLEAYQVRNYKYVVKPVIVQNPDGTITRDNQVVRRITWNYEYTWRGETIRRNTMKDFPPVSNAATRSLLVQRTHFLIAKEITRILNRATPAPDPFTARQYPAEPGTVNETTTTTTMTAPSEQCVTKDNLTLCIWSTNPAENAEIQSTFLEYAAQQVGGTL